MKKEIHVVVVCGMTQSGSTLLYNIIREFFENNNFSVLGMVAATPSYLTQGYNSERISNPIVQITKQHDATSENSLENMIFINTRRDVRDCLASLNRKNSMHLGGDLLKQAHENMGYFETGKIYSNFQWNYEDYKSDPIEYTKKMFKFLSKFAYRGVGEMSPKNKKINPDSIDDTMIAKTIHTCENIKNLNIPVVSDSGGLEEVNLYNMTLMTKEHITSNDGKIGAYKETFTEKQINLIEEKCGPWLVENGYMK